MLSVWIDAVVAVLLVATIGYSMLLSKRLSAVRSDRDKFESVIKNLSAASQRAEAAVANLRSTADDMGRRLDKKVEEARALSDDLAYMIERGGGIADKLAASIRSGRDRLKPEMESRLEFAPESAPELRAERKSEHRIEPVARPVPRAEAPRQAAPAPLPAAAPRRAPLLPEPRIIAERVTAPPQDRTSATSRAERELLRALSRRR